MSATLELEPSYAALHEGLVGRASHRDVVLVAGPDARSFLQGQCTQDLSSLVTGESVESLLLSPQGKFEAYVRIACLGAEELAVVADPGSGEVVYERLRRFKLRVKATLEIVSWALVELRGPGASPAGARGVVAFSAKIDWPGLSGLDILGPSLELADEVPKGDEAAFEAARIEAGWPVSGRELTEKTIPQEAGIETRTVSFTKGCYTGQELIARLDARGNKVPWRLRGLRFVGPTIPEPGALVHEDGREIGHVTSAAFSPAKHCAVGLCYLRRDVVLPVSVVVGADLAAEAVELPIA